jgi:hypothetical protein
MMKYRFCLYITGETLILEDNPKVQPDAPFVIDNQYLWQIDHPAPIRRSTCGPSIESS